MSSPDPDFWQSVANWLWGLLLLPVGVVWKKVDGAAQKADMDKADSDLKAEQDKQRNYIGSLFEKLEQHSRRDEELFREVMGTMASNHAEVLRALGNKADR